MGAHGGGKKLLRVGQHPPLDLQLFVFPLPDGRALNLVLLKAPQVGFAQARLFIAFQATQAGTNLRPLGKRRRHPLGGDAGAPVQQLPLLGLVKAAHGFALGVHQRQLRSELAQHIHRGRLIVHVDAALAPGLDLAAQDDLRAFGIDAVAFQRVFRARRALKDAGHHRPIRSMPHHIGGGLIAHQQSQRIHQDGLARTRLSGQQIETGTEDSNGVINDGVIFSAEFEQHGKVRAQHSMKRCHRLLAGLPCAGILCCKLVSLRMSATVKEEVMMSPVHIAAFLLLQADDAAAPVAHSPTSGFSAVIDMVRNSGPVAIAVLVLLLIASLYSWAVILGKSARSAERGRKAGVLCAPSARPTVCRRSRPSASNSSPAPW